MTTLQWSEEFSVGNDRIDFEHRIFYGLINEYRSARESNEPQDKLARILQEIALYAKFHFRSEENIMIDVGYPDVERHRIQHYSLIEVLNNKMLGLDMGSCSYQEVEDFLLVWFVLHVTREDSKLSEFIRNDGS